MQQEKAPRQRFLIRTPSMCLLGTLEKRKGRWSVVEIDPRLSSLKGMSAHELRDKCLGWGWRVERYSQEA
jgi:hypothetical protein